MKIEDVIRELRVDPDKEFTDGTNTIGFNAKHITYIKPIYSFNLVTLAEMNLDAEWQEVKKPVTFMDAVNSGKKIRHEGANRYINISVVMQEIDMCFDTDKEIIEIINGKWYIE